MYTCKIKQTLDRKRAHDLRASPKKLSILELQNSKFKNFKVFFSKNKTSNVTSKLFQSYLYFTQ